MLRATQLTGGDRDGTAGATKGLRAWEGVPHVASLAHGGSRFESIDGALLRVLRTRGHGPARDRAVFGEIARR